MLGERVAIAGTAVNCAGGPTPWNTWLTCEETEDKAGTNGYTKDHGFIFEVDRADPRRTGAVPLTAMGRFQHEAIAVDPQNGIVYETEDAFEKPFGLFYRFLPEKPLGRHGLAAGRRHARGHAGARRARPLRDPGDGRELRPDRVGPRTRPAGGARRRSGSRTSGRRASHTPRSWRAVTGAAPRVYFVSSFAHSAEGSAADHFGQVWRYEPKRRRLTLVIVFGPDTDVQLPGESPDNICLAPSGGLMVCEDGGGAQHVFGVTRRGEVYAMARGRQNIGTPEEPEWGEFAGVTFSPDGGTMFVNCYTPGTTFAVTGPWR